MTELAEFLYLIGLLTWIGYEAITVALHNYNFDKGE